MRRDLGAETNARVAYRQTDLLALRGEPHLDAAVAWGELDRVRNEIPHDLLQAIGVRCDGAERRIEVQGDGHPFRFRGRSERLHGRVDQRLQKDRMRTYLQLPDD